MWNRICISSTNSMNEYASDLEENYKAMSQQQQGLYGTASRLSRLLHAASQAAAPDEGQEAEGAVQAAAAVAAEVSSTGSSVENNGKKMKMAYRSEIKHIGW